MGGLEALDYLDAPENHVLSVEALEVVAHAGPLPTPYEALGLLHCGWVMHESR